MLGNEEREKRENRIGHALLVGEIKKLISPTMVAISLFITKKRIKKHLITKKCLNAICVPAGPFSFVSSSSSIS